MTLSWSGCGGRSQEGDAAVGWNGWEFPWEWAAEPTFPETSWAMGLGREPPRSPWGGERVRNVTPSTGQGCCARWRSSAGSCERGSRCRQWGVGWGEPTAGGSQGTGWEVPPPISSELSVAPSFRRAPRRVFGAVWSRVRSTLTCFKQNSDCCSCHQVASPTLAHGHPVEVTGQESRCPRPPALLPTWSRLTGTQTAGFSPQKQLFPARKHNSFDKY